MGQIVTSEVEDPGMDSTKTWSRNQLSQVYREIRHSLRHDTKTPMQLQW
jgi:hypothetical protein